MACAALDAASFTPAAAAVMPGIANALDTCFEMPELDFAELDFALLPKGGILNEPDAVLDWVEDALAGGSEKALAVFGDPVGAAFGDPVSAVFGDPAGFAAVFVVDPNAGGIQLAAGPFVLPLSEMLAAAGVLAALVAADFEPNW